MNIDYDALKKKGFLRSRQEYFTLRTRMAAGNYSPEQLEKLSSIAKQYGRGLIHLTTRQGAEIPFIRFQDIEAVAKEVEGAGIGLGTSGPRLRATTVCPGNNWCKRGLVDTFRLFDRIEGSGIRCGLDLPHKFKISISGCPNRCTRAEASEIGIHGDVQDDRVGYRVYLGGCGGKIPHLGFRLDKLFSEDEVLALIEKVINFFKNNAKPRQRLASLIEATGREEFLKFLTKN